MKFIQTASYLLAFLATLFSVTAMADITQVDNASLEQLRADGVAIIDVRRQDEWEKTGLIQGSHPLTFFDEKGRYDIQAWVSELDAIVKPDQAVVLICAHGVRTSKIAALLDKRLGYSKVHNVTEGISAWLDDDRPVEQYQP